MPERRPGGNAPVPDVTGIASTSSDPTSTTTKVPSEATTDSDVPLHLDASPPAFEKYQAADVAQRVTRTAKSVPPASGSDQPGYLRLCTISSLTTTTP